MNTLKENVGRIMVNCSRQLGTALTRLEADCGLVAYRDDRSASLSIWTSTLTDITTVFVSVGDKFV